MHYRISYHLQGHCLHGIQCVYLAFINISGNDGTENIDLNCNLETDS